MKIVQAHKFYWYRDGASNYALDLSKMLEKRGQLVIPFAMKHPKNLKSGYAKYFVSTMDLADPRKVGLINKIKFAGRMFYSLEAKRKMTRLVREKQPDIVHLHNIYHHISPSILPVFKKAGIPVVMTLHDYKLICPNYTMFHHGRIHEEDCRGWYGSCVKNRCLKDSRAQSRIVRWEMIFHHKIKRYYERCVDKFIAPSEFILNKCVEHGWDKDKFVHIPHPIDLARFKPSRVDGDYVAYVGRLSEEKGLETLIAAAALTSRINYKIIGTGPAETYLKGLVDGNNMGNIEFTGFKTGQELDSLLKGAKLMVVPSIWYENYPLSVLEPKALGKVVIASKIGGIKEMLPKELLVPPENPKKLAEKIEHWYKAGENKRERLGNVLRQDVQKINNPKDHLKAILNLYKDLIK